MRWRDARFGCATLVAIAHTQDPSRLGDVSCDIAKAAIDVGLHTTNKDAMLAFWQGEIGLPFHETLPVGAACISCATASANRC